MAQNANAAADRIVIAATADLRSICEKVVRKMTVLVYYLNDVDDIITCIFQSLYFVLINIDKFVIIKCKFICNLIKHMLFVLFI